MAATVCGAEHAERWRHLLVSASTLEPTADGLALWVRRRRKAACRVSSAPVELGMPRPVAVDVVADPVEEVRR